MYLKNLLYNFADNNKNGFLISQIHSFLLFEKSQGTLFFLLATYSLWFLRSFICKYVPSALRDYFA